MPHGTLFADGIAARVKKQLVEDFNLHTIVRLGEGIFAPYTDIPSNLLFFSARPNHDLHDSRIKGLRDGKAVESPNHDLHDSRIKGLQNGKAAAEKEAEGRVSQSGQSINPENQGSDVIWYYELPPPDGRKKYSKTKPIQHEEFTALKAWWNAREENANAWKVRVEDLGPAVNLDVKNPNRRDEIEYREPAELVSSILEKERQVLALMEEIERLVKEEVLNEA